MDNHFRCGHHILDQFKQDKHQFLYNFKDFAYNDFCFYKQKN